MIDSGRTIGEAKSVGPHESITGRFTEVPTNTTEHTGNKYHRTIYQLKKYDRNFMVPVSIKVDVYCVIDAYKVTRPGLQHCIKKLLCAGIRGKATEVQDLREARDALDRAIEDAERDAMLNEKPEVSNPPGITCCNVTALTDQTGTHVHYP